MSYRRRWLTESRQDLVVALLLVLLVVACGLFILSIRPHHASPFNIPDRDRMCPHEYYNCIGRPLV